MATYKVLYWQEVPSQIRAEDDTGDVSLELPAKFMDRIDVLAAERGLSSADDYLAQWHWSDEDERPLPLANLRQAARVEDATPRRIAAIYLLQRSTAAASAVVPVAQVEVFAAAASDNLRTSNAGITASHAARFAALAELFRRVPSFGLVAGANPADLGQTVIDHHNSMVAP